MIDRPTSLLARVPGLLRLGLPATLAGLLVLALALPLVPAELVATPFGSDGGDLLGAMLTGGVPHPSGYPTYMLLGRLLQQIPWGTPLWRGALLSALPLALACGLLVMAAIRQQEDRRPAALLGGVAAGLLWGTAPLGLALAASVEVYGLHALFVVLALGWFLCLRLNAGNWRRLALLLLALIYGLGLGNHLTLLLLLPAIIVAQYAAWRGGLPRRWLAYQLLCLAAGLAVYLYLPLSARRYPPVNWGNPQTWEGFWWVLSAAPYQKLVSFKLFGLPLDSSLGSLTQPLGQRLLAWLVTLRDQFGVPGLALGALGAYPLRTTDRYWVALGWWTFLSYSLFAVAYQTADSVAYLLPALIIFSWWIGQALRGLWDVRWRSIAWGRVVVLATLVFFAARLPGNVRNVLASQDSSIDRAAQAILASAPQQALVITQSDPDTFPLWYYHYGLGRRADLAVIAMPLAQFRWYQETLARTYPGIVLPESGQSDASGWVEQAVQLNPERPVCRSNIVLTPELHIWYVCS